MKEDKDDVVLLNADTKDKIDSEKDESEDMVVDVVGADGGSKVDLGFDKVAEQSSGTGDLVMEDANFEKPGNGPVVEGSREPLDQETEAGGEKTIDVKDKEVVVPNVDSEKQVDDDVDGKNGKEVEVLSSLKVSEVAEEGLVGTGESNVDESTKNEEEGVRDGDDQTGNESLQSTVDVTVNAVQKSGGGLTEETVERGIESVKEDTDEVSDSTKVSESAIEVVEVVVEENLTKKDEVRDVVSEDQSSVPADNPSLSSDVVNRDENLDQKAEISKEESSQSRIEAETDDVQKMDDESRSKDSQSIEVEIDVADKEKESEIGLTKETMEKPTGSVKEVDDADHPMDETTEKETEALDLSKIPDLETRANLGSEEADVEVVEDGLERKGEPQVVVNAETGDGVGADKLPNSVVQDLTVSGILVEDENLKANDVADETTEPHTEVPTIGVPNTSVEDFDKANHETTHAGYAEHVVLPANTQFSYDEAQLDRGDDAGMDIDEVLGWKDEFDEQKTDPTNLSIIDENVDVDVVEQEIDASSERTMEAKQWYETAVSLYQSCYFHPPVNEGEFSVSDLVWGKVRSHPWWPGQIFDPSDASEKAMKYHKKDCFLVAYFGDRSFAWNESTVLKPFRSKFSQIANHTNSEAFNNAVHCALEEVSRRVELGLACSCIPRDIYENIKCQIVENAGIKQESSKRDGIDKSASVNSFEPDKLVDYVRLLAKFPYGESDKMEITMAKAQLSSYGRFKRYRQLAEFQLCGDVLEDMQVMNDDGSKKRKADDSISDGSEKRPSLDSDPVATAKLSFKVGASIQKVASQLTGPVKTEPADQVVISAVSDQAELLSQLHLFAQDPMKKHSFLNNVIPFFSSHRAAVINKIRQDSIDARKRKISNENDPEEFEFDDVNDSYWTDRIIQNYPDEQLLQEHQNGGAEQHQIVTYEQDKQQHVKPTRRSNKKRFFSSNHEIEAKEQLELIERRRLNLATEVLMKFTEGIYFPSEIHLNKMFRRFGPLMESETEVDRQSGRARVVFKKCSDAEVAHSSAGKFNIFGSIVVKYELNYTPLISYKPLPLPLAQDTTAAC
ncbi:uncharacterized protein [Rutidosis leptorrhynchoides]|uniref:uncharacterized protein n=1 Tax=Rutidosis leptorrhynchoides TaxID=125765 RepID=UPI003A9A1649